jgi:hypothetical protein
MPVEHGKMQVTGPKRLSYQETPGGFFISCSTRSLLGFIMAPLVIVWSGLFVGIVLRVANLAEHLSAGFMMVCLLLAVFITLGVALTLMHLCGEVTFHLSQGVLSYFAGLRPIGRRENIKWTSIVDVRDAVEHWGRNKSPVHLIYLEGVKRYRVGRFLSQDQREFVVNVLCNRIGRTGQP